MSQKKKIELKQIAHQGLVSGVAKGASKVDDSGITIDFTGVDNAIALEASTRTSQDAAISGSLAQEVSRAQAAEGVLTSDLAAEVSRATAAEGVNAAAITAEQTRATAAEGVIAADLVAEAAARTSADAALQGQINFITNNTDQVAIDSLTEIVSAFQAADGTLNGAITTLGANLQAAIDAVQLDVDGNETDADAAIAAEVAARVAGDSAIINSESTYGDLKAVGDELRSILLTLGNAARSFNQYGELQLDLVHEVASNENVELIFAAPGTVNHSNTTSEKLNFGTRFVGNDFFVNGNIDFSKAQVFLNGVLLQGGTSLMQDDYVFFTGANPGSDPLEMRFAEGLLEKGDVLSIYVSMK